MPMTKYPRELQCCSDMLILCAIETNDAAIQNDLMFAYTNT